MGRFPEMRFLRLVIQELEAYGINKIASVELNASGANQVRVQGVQESWVVGKAESLASHLRSKEETLATSLRKFGLSFNIVLALAAIALIPELTPWRRFFFGAAVVVIAWAFTQIHERYIPNALIFFSDRPPGLVEGAWPTLLSWLIAATSGLAAAVVYGLLKGELGWLNVLWRGG
jgi:hypothetical protein